MEKTALFLSFFWLFIALNAQSPKREMRAGWLTTVYRIDWPTTPIATGTPANIAKQKLS
jgi:hypothetical protein